jgi:hypothetical protein
VTVINTKHNSDEIGLYKRDALFARMLGRCANDESERMWKESVVVVLSRNWSRRTEEKQEERVRIFGLRAEILDTK